MPLAARIAQRAAVGARLVLEHRQTWITRPNLTSETDLLSNLETSSNCTTESDHRKNRSEKHWLRGASDDVGGLGL